MNNHKDRLEAFFKLGKFLRNYCEIVENDNNGDEIDKWVEELNGVVKLAKHKNGWFTYDNVQFSLQSWGALLTKDNLENWLSSYNIELNNPKSVALIMAGNIPLVGFHDFLCVLLTGNSVLIKVSSNDDVLLPFITKYLGHVCPGISDNILFTEAKLDDFDAVIATGSNNTSRYFEHYFGHKPNIIRKNRNSIAILTGNENKTQLKALGEDVFRYYGLGCRSVSKLFVPIGYKFDEFFEAIFEYSPIINQIKYANNYDYNKAVYLMSEFKILENGFLMLKEDESYSSPIATLFYEHYESLNELKERLKVDQGKIQCIVAKDVFDDEIKFGQTQTPSLSDYADGVDTVEFLLKT